MIPDFDERGYLPPGIHVATLAEIEERFGKGSELRQVQMQSIHWLVDLAKRVGVQRLVINGSFVTDVFEPNDVDCVALIAPEFPSDSAAEADLQKGLPFVSLELVKARRFDYLTQTFFATHRSHHDKRMIEVTL